MSKKDVNKKGPTSTEAVAAVREAFPKNKGGRYMVDQDGKATCIAPPSKPPKAREAHESKSNV